jgi:hypothetical protein
MTISMLTSLKGRAPWIGRGWSLLRQPNFRLMRAHPRYACCIVATLTVIDRDLELEGLVLEIAQGGLLFREASNYIFDRHGAAVRIRFAGHDLEGLIVNVQSGGYGVKLSAALGAEEVAALVAGSGSRAGLSAAA